MLILAHLLAAAGPLTTQMDGAPETARVERLAAAMGTTLAIRVDAPERADGLAASEVALRALEDAERRLSTWQADSELARFNAAAPGTEVELSSDLAQTLARAEHWRRETGGAFDPAVADLVALWGLREGGREPSAEELARALGQRGPRAGLELSGTTAVRGPLALEEGGFGKGAGLDAALAALAGAPIRAASLDLGGQVAVLGGEEGFTWTLADPRDRLRPVLSYTIDSGSVATSGTSERGAHIIDPASGRPVDWDGSISVWAASALDADCLSTGLFVLGPEAALEFAGARSGIEVLVLEPRADGGLDARASAGWLGRVQALNADVRLEIAGSQPIPAAAASASYALDQDDERIARLEAHNAELERRIDSLAGEIERVDLGDLVPPVGESQFGLGPAASKVYGVEQGVSLGGYGEVLYEDFESDLDDGSSGAPDEFDLLRAVLYVGYKFDEHWVFNSELEFEHAGEEVGVEFAYLEYLHSEALNARGGHLLVPMGLINERHEPTTFLSAKRPGVESVILPTTWHENGAGLLGAVGQFDYEAYLINGFDGAGFAASGLRDGRQGGSEAVAEDLAGVARLDWNGVPGLMLGVSGYQGDSGQTLSGVDLDTTIYEGHVDWNWRGLSVRGLVAQAELDDVAALNAALGLAGTASVGEELEGYYVELGYDVLGALRPESGQSLSPFVRYEAYDTQAEVPAGFASDPANDVEITTVGLAYKPHHQIVIKVDWMDADNDAGTGQDQLNVAMGYVF